MSSTKNTTLLTLAALAALAACGKDPDPGPGTTQQPIQCTSQTYAAFDVVNHMPQDLRLQAYVDMGARMDEAVANPALANAKFTEAEGLYKNTARQQFADRAFNKIARNKDASHVTAARIRPLTH